MDHRCYGWERSAASSPDEGAYHDRSEFKLRVHDHDQHQFEPSPALPEKPQPFTPRKHRRFPIVVPVLLLANTIVFILMMHSNNCPRTLPSGCVAEWLNPLAFQPWSENPILGPRREELLHWGALESRRVVKSGEGWRLLSAIAVNGGLIHLLATLLALLVVGLRLEFAFGFLELSAVYILSGFSGSVLSALFIQGQIFAGASGAVMGLIGASVADVITNWDVIKHRIADLALFTLFALVSLTLGLFPQVDNFANIGGFISGFLLGFGLLLRPQRGFKDTRHLSQLDAFIANNEESDMPAVTMHRKSQRVVQVIALVLFAGLLIAACVVLFLDVRHHEGCSWCRYLACVPDLKWTCPGPYL